MDNRKAIELLERHIKEYEEKRKHETSPAMITFELEECYQAIATLESEPTVLPQKAIEFLKAAMGDEGDMIYCFNVNMYSGEIPQTNEAKRIELIRLALVTLESEPVRDSDLEYAEYKEEEAVDMKSESAKKYGLCLACGGYFSKDEQVYVGYVHERCYRNSDEPCETCGGSGKVPCDYCGGKGSCAPTAMCKKCDSCGKIPCPDCPTVVSPSEFRERWRLAACSAGTAKKCNLYKEACTTIDSQATEIIDKNETIRCYRNQNIKQFNEIRDLKKLTVDEPESRPNPIE